MTSVRAGYPPRYLHRCTEREQDTFNCIHLAISKLANKETAVTEEIIQSD